MFKFKKKDEDFNDFVDISQTRGPGSFGPAGPAGAGQVANLPGAGGGFDLGAQIAAGPAAASGGNQLLESKIDMLTSKIDALRAEIDALNTRIAQIERGGQQQKTQQPQQQSWQQPAQTQQPQSFDFGQQQQPQQQQYPEQGW